MDSEIIYIKRSIEKDGLPKEKVTAINENGEKLVGIIYKIVGEKKYMCESESDSLFGITHYLYPISLPDKAKTVSEILEEYPSIKGIMGKYYAEKFVIEIAGSYVNQFPSLIQEGMKEEAIGLLAKEKNIVCWMVPNTYPDRVEWGYEMEIIPYTDTEKYFRDNPIEKIEGNHVYSYAQWKTYDEAFKEMILHANSLYDLYQSQKQK